MNRAGRVARFALPFAAALAVATGSAAAATADDEPLEVARGTFVFRAAAGNLIVHVGRLETLVAGVLSPEANASVRRFLERRAAPRVRYAIATDAPGAAAYGDGGWGADGAVTIAQERLRWQMKDALQAKGANVQAALPALGFSAVQQVYLSDDEAHAVYQIDGARNADVSVHFEQSQVLYLGTLYSTDGYPDLDPDNGGSLDGLIKTVDWFVDGFADSAGVHIVPGHGPVADGAALKDYAAMLHGVRDRLGGLIAAGLDDEAILARRPLREYDARWGRGRLDGSQFAALALRSLRRH